MKVKLNKAQAKLMHNGSLIIGSDGNSVMWNPLFYKETEEPNIYEALTFKELSKNEQKKVLGDYVKDLKYYMDKYGDE